MNTPAFRTLHDLQVAHEALLARLQQALRERAPDADERQALLALQGEIEAIADAAARLGSRLADEFIDDRTAAQVILDYWTAKLGRATGQPSLRQLDAYDPATNTPLPDEDCPYPGAGPLEDAPSLFGRADEVDAAVALIERCPLLLVTGPAGCGKSSLVSAGVLPALRAQRGKDGMPRWQVPERIAAGADAVQALRAAAAPAPPLVLTIDPVETMFASADAGAAQALAAAVHTLLASGAGHRVVMVLREESLGRVRELKPLLPWLGAPAAGGGDRSQPMLVVGPLTPAQLRDAIAAPAARVGLLVHPQVIDRVVASIAGQRDALALLQHAAQAIWKARDGGHVVGRARADRILDSIETYRWQLEAERQAAVVQREREHTKRAEAVADAQRRLARRERRQRNGALVVVALLAAVLGFALWAFVEARADLTEVLSEVRTVERQQERPQQGAEVAVERLEGELGICRREAAECLVQSRRAEPVEVAPAPAASPPVASVAPPVPVAAPPAPAAAPTAVPPPMAAPIPRPAPAPAPPPPPPIVAAPAPAPTAAAPARVVASAAPAAPAAPAVPAKARAPLSEDEKLARARRLVQRLDRGQAGEGDSGRTPTYPISWAWAKSRWSELNLKTPLALAVLFDTAVAHGPMQAATFRARVVPAGADPADEQALVQSYLDRRRSRQEDALRPGMEAQRIQALQDLIDRRDWWLDADDTKPR